MNSSSLLAAYPPLPGTYDELFAARGEPRQGFQNAVAALENRVEGDFARQQALAELALLNQGVTFSVYDDARGSEKIFPFCLLPRIVSAADWERLEGGLLQRVRVLEAFLADVYGPQRILSEQRIPAELVLGSKGYVPALRGLAPPGGVRLHIAGIDLIRDPAGVFRVLEDNLRTPSGVSYVIENRLLSKRILPEALARVRVRRVEQYPERLARALRSVAPCGPDGACAVVLTPGPYNSAYFEHSFLARTMGLELVQAADLFVDGDKVFVPHHARPAPRRRHLPPHRRGVPRSGGVPPRQPARRARPDARLRGRQRRARQRARQRRRRRQGGLPVRARHDPLLPRRGAAPRAGADLRLPARRRSRLRARAPRRAGGQGGRRGRAATAC